MMEGDGKTPIGMKETMTQPDRRQAWVMSQAIRESRHPLAGIGRRGFISPFNRWSSSPAMVLSDGREVRVGYRDPVIDNRALVVLRNEFNPQYGIRVGDSDKVYSKPEAIEQVLGNNTKDVMMPVLYQLAHLRNRLSHDTIQQAADLDAVTILIGENPEQSSLYLPDADADKIIKYRIEKPHSEITADDIEEAKKTIGDKAVQRMMKSIASQALTLQSTVEGFVTITAANGNNWKVELTPEDEIAPGDERHAVFFSGANSADFGLIGIKRALEQEYAGAENIRVFNSVFSTDRSQPRRFRQQAAFIVNSIKAGHPVDAILHSLGGNEFARAVDMIEKYEPGFFDDPENAEKLTIVALGPGGIATNEGDGRAYAKRSWKLREHFIMPPLSKNRTLLRGLDGLVAFPLEGVDDLSGKIRAVMDRGASTIHQGDTVISFIPQRTNGEVYLNHTLSVEQRAALSALTLSF